MATTVAAPTYAPAKPKTESGLWSWLTTTDHKKIGVLYLVTSLFFFVVGGLEAAVIRAQLAGPNLNVVSAETYGRARPTTPLSTVVSAPDTATASVPCSPRSATWLQCASRPTP